MSNTLMRSHLDLPGIAEVYHGKVRDVYHLSDDRTLLVAGPHQRFRCVASRGIPHKGQVLSQLSWNMLQATAHIAPNWAIASPDPNGVVGHRCETAKVEMVVRGYLAGHAWRTYQEGKRTLCGASMPEGLKENDRFPVPLITPSTKADVGHDEDISPKEILERGLCTPEEWETMSRYALALFAEGSRIANERGLILVDTKYEFGRTKDGRILLIDEVHTPGQLTLFPPRRLRGTPSERGATEATEQGVRQGMVDREPLHGQGGPASPRHG